MFYQDNPADRLAVTNALGRWYARGRASQLFAGAWLQVSSISTTTLLYNCGGVNNGGGYGIDYVDSALYQWLTTNLPPGWTFTGPTTVWGGNIGANWQPQFTSDYYNITRPLPDQLQLGPDFTFPGIPDGDYTVIVNFHLYVDGWQLNPSYIAPLPPQPPAQAPAPLNINDLTQFPPLG